MNYCMNNNKKIIENNKQKCCDASDGFHVEARDWRWLLSRITWRHATVWSDGIVHTFHGIYNNEMAQKKFHTFALRIHKSCSTVIINIKPAANVEIFSYHAIYFEQPNNCIFSEIATTAQKNSICHFSQPSFFSFHSISLKYAYKYYC